MKKKKSKVSTRKGKDLDWVDVFLEHGIDVPGQTLFINNEIGPGTLDVIVSGLHLIGHNKDVLVLINSIGGSLSEGLGIYDSLLNHGGKVTGRVVGEACSAACIILQACDVREATKHSIIMHHVGEAHYGNHAKNFALFTDFYKKQLSQIDTIMIDRINEALTSRGEPPMKLSVWKNRNQWDTWLTPEEAKTVGLLDYIVGEEND
jgi:ATP-dependent protease ClpP protease subunit